MTRARPAQGLDPASSQDAASVGSAGVLGINNRSLEVIWEVHPDQSAAEMEAHL